MEYGNPLTKTRLNAYVPSNFGLFRMAITERKIFPMLHIFDCSHEKRSQWIFFEDREISQNDVTLSIEMDGV